MSLLSFLYILLGVALLYFGGEALVSGASSLARAVGLSPLVIGLTVVAFATSSPELFATAVATFEGAPALGVGNVLGSNIANLGLILGLAALLRPLVGRGEFLRREIPVLIAVAVIPFGLLWDGEVSRWEGGILVLFLVGYVLHLLRDSDAPEVEAEVEARLGELRRPWWLSAGAVALGLGLLVAGAHFLVEGAVDVARALGVSDRVIGLTLVAFGTSLPELASSLAAARRREGDIVLGNVVGSNIFNVLCVLGLTAVAKPIGVGEEGVLVDMLVGLGLSLAMVPLLLLGRRLYLGRWEGAVLAAAYLVYVALLFV